MALRQIVSMLLCCMLFVAIPSGCSPPKQATTVDFDLGEPKKAHRPVTPENSDPKQREQDDKQASERSKEPERQPDRQSSMSGPNGGAATDRAEPVSSASTNRTTDGHAEATDGEPGSGQETAEPMTTPVFPGRQTAKSGRSPEAAAEAARRALNLARAAVKRGDPDTASREAITAYEIAAEHAKSDTQCSEILRDADRLLEAIGRRQHPQDVPTRFE